MSQGDLTIHITEEYVGNFVALKESINHIAASIHETMKVIADAVRVGNRLVEDTTGAMQQAVELTQKVHEQLKSIAENINNEVELVSGVSGHMEKMGSFTTNTQATSQECVALSDDLYNQVNLMNEKINVFKLEP